jgi:hypothetical protein
MIYLTKGSTSQIILTLKEKQTLSAPNYLFVFTHRGSNIEVKFVILNAADTSSFKDRFNQFSIVTNTYFGTQDSGEWEYQIYEQTSTTNTNPANATGLVETGIMRLNESTSFTYMKHQPNNTFIVR